MRHSTIFRKAVACGSLSSRVAVVVFAATIVVLSLPVSLAHATDYTSVYRAIANDHSTAHDSTSHTLDGIGLNRSNAHYLDFYTNSIYQWELAAPFTVIVETANSDTLNVTLYRRSTSSSWYSVPFRQGTCSSGAPYVCVFTLDDLSYLYDTGSVGGTPDVKVVVDNGGNVNSNTYTIKRGFDWLPNLRISDLRTSGQWVVPGTTVGISETTLNDGGLATRYFTWNTTNRCFWVDYYVSTTPGLSGIHEWIASRYIENLEPGASNSVNGPGVTVPLTWTSEDYYLVAVADGTNVVRELDETDNTRSVLLHRSPPHSLTVAIDSISPNPAVYGASVSFSGTTADNRNHSITEYKWRSSIDGIIGNSASFSTSSLSPGSHTIYFSARCSNGTWSSEQSRGLTISAPHSVSAAIGSIDPNPAQQGTYVSFSGSGSDSSGHAINAYQWRSSLDGVFGWSDSLQTSSLSVGTHTIYFKAQCSNGTWSPEVSQQLTINAPPPHNVTGGIDSISPNPAAQGQSVAFSGHGSDSSGHSITEYQWRSSINGVLSTAASFSTASLSAGTHTIYFKARCANGTWSPEVSQQLTIDAPPHNVTAAIDSLGPNPATRGEMITFSGHGSDSSGHSITEYQWRSSINGVLSAAASFSTASLSAGTHTIYFKAKCANGTWSPEVSQQLTVSMPPPHNVTAVIDSIHPNPAGLGQAVSFSGHGSDSSGHSFTEHQWRSSIDGVLSAAASFSTSSLSAGTHTIYFKAKCANGTWSSEQSMVLRIDPAHNVTAVIDSINPNPAGLGQAVSFSGHGSDSSGHSFTEYQWRSSIDGVLSAASSFSKSNLSAGTHTVYFKAKCANGTWSPEAQRQLVIGGVPNDAFTLAVQLNGSDGSVTGSNAGATKEAGEPAHAGNPGGTSVWYRWTAPASGRMEIDTIGSDFDTVLGVYTGTSVNVLTTVASDDDSGGSYTSKLSFQAVQGTTYRIAVDGYYGRTGGIKLNWVFALNAASVVAYIDSIVPNPSSLGQIVTLTGHGSDTQGHAITEWEWRSSIDGAIGSNATVCKWYLSPGTHTVFFKVKCADGTWSSERSQSLTVGSAGSGREFERIAGATRYETAVEISRRGWTRSDWVVIATGSNFPDALAGAPLAYAYDCPLLLVTPTSLPAAARSELIRLGVKNAFILGSEAAVGIGVADEMSGLGIDVTRLGGANRYDTARMIADEVKARVGTVSKVVIASGGNYPDALAISPFAARMHYPILLTRRDDLPEETRGALEALAPPSAIVVGGSAAVSDDVLGQLPAPTRLGGESRYGTAREISDYAGREGMSWTCPFLTTGENYPDALAAGALAAHSGSPLLLTLPDALSAGPWWSLSVHLDDIERVILVGGVKAVSQETEDDVRDMLDAW